MSQTRSNHQLIVLSETMILIRFIFSSEEMLIRLFQLAYSADACD